jgi:hypothetical protein
MFINATVQECEQGMLAAHVITLKIDGLFACRRPPLAIHQYISSRIQAQRCRSDGAARGN